MHPVKMWARKGNAKFEAILWKFEKKIESKNKSNNTKNRIQVRKHENWIKNIFCYIFLHLNACSIAHKTLSIFLSAYLLIFFLLFSTFCIKIVCSICFVRNFIAGKRMIRKWKYLLLSLGARISFFFFIFIKFVC